MNEGSQTAKSKRGYGQVLIEDIAVHYTFLPFKHLIAWRDMGIRGAILTFLALLLAAAAPLRSDEKPQKPDTPHLTFVKEFIRELSAIEEIRSNGEQDLKKDPNGTFANMIHSATLFKLELASQIRMLGGMSLSDPFDTLIPSLSGFYEEKIKLWDRMKEIGGSFIGGPREGIDYQKLAAEVPEVRARLEYMDQSIFQASPLVFSTLIDMKPDSKNHVSHLVITKAERAELLDSLDTAFGKKLDEKNPNYTVGTAVILRDALKKGYKCSDEPWE
jgi:hypothetical protein